MGTSKAALLLTVAGVALTAAVLAFSFGKAAQAQAPTLSVDAGAGQHAINPNIYGIANYGLNVTFAQEIQVPNIRWGGDGTTRYNWQVDSSNSGFDWYFMGGNGETTPVPSASVDLMINTYKPASALITIPIIPYVNSTAAWTCSFPTSVYGAQQSTNPYVHPNGENCGNSITTAGVQLTDNNILANHIANSVSLQQGWVQHLVKTFGTAAKGGVPFYQLDNEPAGWANTHRDVEPTPPLYSTIVSLGEQYATAIKQADSTAMVLGPSDFTLGGWIGNPSAQNNLFAGQYYLQQFAAYDTQNGTRSLDYFDEHYYPQFTTPATQLASTRTFWDPTYNGGTWVEQYYFDGPMQLIPRFHQWISQYYPGTKLSFSEYSIDSGNKLITDALAEADVLGIFGQQGVDFANMWSAPASTDPIAYAFRVFRNYDGQGGQFGSTGVSAVSSNPGNLSIYAAVRATDGALTIVVINKTTAAIATSVALANETAAAGAEVYSYSSANMTQITSQGSTPIVDNSISYTFPAYSATVFVVVSSQAAVLTSPTPGLSTKLSATNASFQWTAGAGVSEYQLSLGTTAPGATDLYVYKGTATSTTVPTLPANGVTVYATLYSKINGAWQSNAYLYTESGTAAPAVLTSPTPGVGTVLGTTSVSFQWTAGTGVTEYQLNLSAVSAGASDLFTYKGTSTSAIVPNLPSGGMTVYATLYSLIDGAWQSKSYLYTESGALAAKLTSPTPGVGTILGTGAVTFQWTTGAEVTDYQLNLSALTQGGSDLFLYKGTATSAIAATLPANGATVYATLYSLIKGAWQPEAYEYTESGTPTPATLTSPAPGLSTKLGTSNVQFQWTAGIGVSEYQLNLSGIAAGDSDLYSYKGTATTATASMLPANAVEVYARLYSKIAGVWKYNDYDYTESGTPTPAVLTSPTPGLSTVLGTSNVVFQWSTGVGVHDYQLNLSDIAPGGSDLFLYKGTATSASVTTLPANGGTVYATLYSYINGAWQSNSYTFTASPSPPTAFTPLHLYYLSPTGSDSNSGTSASEAWATPNHAVDCGDVIIAAAGSYTGQFNQNWGAVSNCPSASGGIDGKGGIYFATLLCAGPDLEACQVNSGVNHFGFDIEQESNWAVEGFKTTTDGADDSNQVTPAYDGACGGNKGPCNGVYHHFAFINDIAYNSADGFGPSGYDQQGIYGVDYLAIVGDIAQNSAQGNPNSWYCVAAIDIVAPANYDTQPGTHLYEYGNFSYNNQTSCPTDVENFMFDTWDANGYSNRGVAQNNMGWLSGRFGFNVFDQDINPTAATAFILNNTLYGSNQLDVSAWASGDINIQNSSSSATSMWGGLTIENNLVQENQGSPGGDSSNGYVYAFNLGGAYSNVTVGGSGSQNYFDGLATTCRGNGCAPTSAPYGAASFGTAAELGTNEYMSPAFNNPSDLINNQSGTPNCSGFTNTTACMGYNANTHTLTNPSAIYDLQPSASGASSAGYQLPSTACVTSGPVHTYYPVWLKGVVYLHWNSSTQTITENTDLVTKPCGL